MRFERDGLILRGVHPKDKRASFISLSANAKKRLPAVKEQMMKIAEEATTWFTNGKRKLFITLL